MAMSLMEVPHENSKEACDRAVRIITETGFHFMTNAHGGVVTMFTWLGSS